MAEEKQKSIGGLWGKKTKDGKSFLSGNIELNGEKVRLTVWKNTYKEAGDNKPDFRIFLDTWEPTGKQEGSAAKTKTTDKPAQSQDQDDDIPF